MQEKVVLLGAGSALFTSGLAAHFLRQKREEALAPGGINADALAVADDQLKAQARCRPQFRAKK